MRPGLIGFIVFAFIGMTLLEGVMLGEGGILATGITADVSNTTLTIPADTSGFPAASAATPQVIFIDNEQIAYTGLTPTQFNIPANGRGINNTSKSSHTQGSMVYNQEAAMINESAGFNVVQSNTTVGVITIAMYTLGFFTHAIPNMLTWNFSYLSGPAQYIAIFLKAFSAAIIIAIGIMFVSTIYGLLKP